MSRGEKIKRKKKKRGSSRGAALEMIRNPPSHSVISLSTHLPLSPVRGK